MKGTIKICKNSFVSDLDTSKGLVTVAANAFYNEDSDGDISMPGAFTKTLNENFDRLKWFLNHDNTILLGVPIEGKQTDKHLVITGQMNMKKQVSIDTLEDYRLYAEHGKTLEHSVMVQAIKRDPTDKSRVLEWKLWEYSTITSWGANEQTPLLSMKSEKNIAEAIDFMEVCLRKGNYTDQRGKEMEKIIKQLRSLATEEPEEATQKDAEPTPNKVQFSKFLLNH